LQMQQSEEGHAGTRQILLPELLCDVVPVLKHLLDLALVVHCNQQPVTR
jgi:hypothetical protein